MAAPDAAAFKVMADALHQQITQETDAKCDTFKTEVGNQLSIQEDNLNEKFKQAIILLETSITDLQHQTAQCIGGIATAEVKINQALGSKIFEEKSK